MQFRDPQLETSGKAIGFYEREFYFLSNFSSFMVEWKGVVWPTSEYAYHAAKFLGLADDVVEELKLARSSHDAYFVAAKHKDKRRKDWADVKVEIMLDICRHKLDQHEYIRRKLKETGDMRLVEDSPKDSFWGWGEDREGRNELGKVWMKLREELLEQK